MKAKMEERRKALYAQVRNVAPELYERAVQIGHLAMPEFGGHDVLKRAATVEAAAMSLVAEAIEYAANGAPLTAEEMDDEEPFSNGPDTAF